MKYFSILTGDILQPILNTLTLGVMTTNIIIPPYITQTFDASANKIKIYFGFGDINRFRFTNNIEFETSLDCLASEYCKDGITTDCPAVS